MENETFVDDLSKPIKLFFVKAKEETCELYI